VHAKLFQIISLIFIGVIRSTLWLYLLHTATNSLQLSTDIVRNITLLERRVYSHKSSLPRSPIVVLRIIIFVCVIPRRLGCPRNDSIVQF